MPHILNEAFYLRDLGYSNADDSAELPRHRWFYFKEAFSPKLVESAMSDAGCQPGSLVLDPFCGSGTVLLTSAAKGYRAIGIEVNPFLAFVSQTKLLSCQPDAIEQALTKVVRSARKGKASELEGFSSFSEDGGANKWLFNKEVLRTFEGGWSATYEFQNPARDIIRLALLGAALDACNATRDGKCLRYRKDWQKLDYGKDDFLSALDTRITDVKSDLSIQLNEEHRTDVIEGDSRLILKSLGQEQFKVCVTSPPYLNSFDYTDVYRPELFLGKFVKSQDELRALRLRTVRSHVQAKWECPIENSFGSYYTNSLTQIKARSGILWSRRIPLMIQAYFEDMKSVLSLLRKAADPDAKLWLVVSTSAYSGVEIPVDLIIADLGTMVGWFLREVGVLRYLRSSGQHMNRQSESSSQPKYHLRESVIIFSASKP